MKRLLSPGVVLFCLSPMVGELLSGATPPLRFINPISLILEGLLYGGGALLVRELTFRWGKGWPTLLVLGAAYGIIEEGLLCKSFFNPLWPDLGLLGVYGRWGGVNWVWSVELTIYHAFVSIAIPITIVGLLFPDRRRTAWAGRAGLVVVAVLFVADVLFGFLAFGPDSSGADHPYRPPLVPVLGSLAVIVGLVALAKRLPAPAPASESGPVRKVGAVRFFLAGFLGIFLFFFACWVLPNLKYPLSPAPAAAPAAGMTTATLEFHPVVPIAAALALVACGLWTVWRLSKRGAAWTDMHAWALCAGGLTLFVLLSGLHEMNKSSPKNMTGMSLVGLATVVFLVILARRIRRRQACARVQPPTETPVTPI